MIDEAINFLYPPMWYDVEEIKNSLYKIYDYDNDEYFMMSADAIIEKAEKEAAEMRAEEAYL